MTEPTRKELIEHGEWQSRRIAQVEKERDRMQGINDEYIKRFQYFSGRRFLIVDYCIIIQTGIYIVMAMWAWLRFG